MTNTSTLNRQPHKIVEGWEVDDMLDIYKQLDVIKYKGFPDVNP